MIQSGTQSKRYVGFCQCLHPTHTQRIRSLQETLILSGGPLQEIQYDGLLSKIKIYSKIECASSNNLENER